MRILRYLILGVILSFGILGMCNCGNNNSAELYPMPNENDEWGYVDRSGEWVIEPQFSNAYDFQDGIARVYEASDGSYGYIDSNGKWIIEPQYLDAGDFSEGLASVTKKDWEITIFNGENDKNGGSGYLYGYIDKSGECVLKPHYAVAERFVKGVAYVEEYQDIEIGDSVVWHNEISDYITDENGNKYASAVDMSCDSVVPKYISASGETVEVDYPEDAVEINDNRGRYYDVEDDAYGYVDGKGNKKIPAIYEDANEFSEGLALVQDSTTDLWGFIDADGKWVIAPNYDEARSFHDKCAFIIDADGTYGYIDKNGKWIIKKAGYYD